MEADFGMASIKMAGSLILILGLILGLFYVIKRLRLNASPMNHYPQMRIVGTLNLAPKRALALIEICDQWLVVGVGAENVTLISQFDRPEDMEDARKADGSNGRFQALLQKKAFLYQKCNRNPKRKDGNA